MTDKTENGEISKSSETTEVKEDEELSALLDSALDDFNTTGKSKESNQSGGDVKPAEDRRPEPPSTLWNDEFLQQTTARFQQNIQALFSPGPDGSFSAEQLGENIQRLAEAATQTAGFDASPDTEFSNIIAQTLRNLSENTENLQNQISDEDLMNMLGQFGNIADPNTEVNGFLPLMQQMMQNLLSKEILHPALSGIIEKSPEWLEENKATLSPSDYDRYSEQFSLMREVCAELEKESPDDSEEVKNARFELVLNLMQKIQDCGQPPAELVGDLGPMFSLDEHGNPQIPNSPSQCSLM